MSRPINISDTLTFTASSYTGQTNISSENTRYPWSRGYNNSSYTSNYARIQLSASNTSTNCYIYYVFNVSGIPSNATINSVNASVRISRNGYVGSSTVQLYNGTTAKGSSVSFSSTNTTGTSVPITSITNGGSWTVSQLSNLRIRITGRRTSTQNTGYIYLFGMDVTISYSISGTEYEITSTLATDAVDSIDPAGQTYVTEGDDYVLAIYTNDISNIAVEDNGVDVTSSLVHVQEVPETTSTFVPSSYDSANSQVASTDTSNPPANGLTNADSTTRAAFTSNTTAYSTTKFYYNFDCSSIPRNVTITSISCSFKATCSSNYFNTRVGQLCTGTTKKGTGTTITNTSINNTVYVQQIADTGTWTREELDDIKILIEAVRGSSTSDFTLSFYGATLSVTYKAEEHYSYTLTNVSADHTIIISDSIIEIPEEDPQYDYYPITISSINATTEPGRGTTRVVEGTSQTITIYPDDPSIALVTDNGVDITNQLVAHGGTIPTPTVATLSGASYGFTLNNSTGYYVSANKGVNKSAAVCRVSFDFPVRCLVTINYINYAEATYDFGVFGNIDVALSTNYYDAGSGGATITDANYKLACNTSAMNTSSVQTITYEIPSGEHYIDIKFSKDDASEANNDTLQWKITNIEALEPTNYYTYTLSNIQEAHSLIFIFGDVTYYFVTSNGTNAKLFPSGSMVQLPGDYYTLTIVPDDYSYNVTVTDNNTDVTSQVQRKEEEITKEGNTYTVVNYIYKLNNIQGAHNIVVQCSATNTLYIKINGSWVQATKVYMKISGAWVEQTDYTTVFDPNQIYVSGN